MPRASCILTGAILLAGSILADVPDHIQATSPSRDLIAESRTTPSPDFPDRPDLNGTRIEIRDSRNQQIVAHHRFAGRIITKLLWSPDGAFLAMSTVSSGGHSPWHFNSYFWSRSDGQFRSVDHCAGLVVSDDLNFAEPHILTVQVARGIPDGSIDSENPVANPVDLEALRWATPPLQAKRE